MSRRLGSGYVLDAAIGRGATGEVWRGTDGDGTSLAFKLLHESFTSDPQIVQRFLQERTILTGLDHPSLVRVRDLVAEGSTLAIVMDLVDGGDLRGLLAARRTLPPAEACRIGADVAAGLGAVHAAGVVHRDVKPENILLDTRAQPPAPKLTDFGVAKVAMQSGAGRSTMLVGTPTYIAPEMFDGQAPTPAADLYALGILLYEMCCGVPPFTGDSALAVLRQHTDNPPGRPAGVPDLLWEVIWHLLAKVPAARPGPADRVANQLTALAHDLAGAPPAPPLTAPPPPTPPPPVHRVATELAGGQVLSAPPAAGGPGLGGPAAGHPPPPYAPGSPPPPYVPGGPPPSYAPGPPLAPAGRVYRVSGKALGIGTGIVLALALAIVLTVVIVREAGGQSPSDVADAYLSAWNRGDFGRIEDLSCREDRREMLDLDPIEREDSRFGEPPGRYEIVGESVRGERAEVFIELADFEESGNLPLVREDGRWRVCWNRL